MAVNPKVEELILCIIQEVNSVSEEPITAEKLNLLLYLFDIEYYRKHGETFTGFTWYLEKPTSLP